MNVEIKLVLDKKTADLLTHTTCKGFYHEYDGAERFSTLAGDISQVMPTEDDSKTTMYFTDSIASALMFKAYKEAHNIPVAILCDEYTALEGPDEFIIITNENFQDILDSHC